MKQRILSLVLALLLVFSLAGCQSLGATPTSLQEPMELPADGMVSASVFKKAAEQNQILTFTGSADGLRYEWTVFGSDISDPRDLNLALSFATPAEGRLEFVYASEQDFGFSPVLSVYLADRWAAQSATVFRLVGDEAEPLCGASLTGSSATILNFSSTVQTGRCVVLADPEEAAEEIPTEQAPTEQNSQSEAPAQSAAPAADDYTSAVAPQQNRLLSDGSRTEKDQYQTDPIPAGKPLPVEPDDQDVDESKALTCTLSIECSTIFNNLDQLEPAKLDELPSNGVILAASTVTFYEGESVFDLLQRVCKEEGIHLEASWTPIYNSAYVEGIHNLYEFDCGNLSGWMYQVNGWYPNYGCSRYQLAQGDTVRWRYTCDLGKDIGGSSALG